MVDKIWTKANKVAELPMGECLVRYRHKNMLSYVVSHREEKVHIIGGYFNFDFDSVFELLAYTSIGHLMDAEVEEYVE